MTKLNTNIKFTNVYEVEDPYSLLKDKKFKLTENAMYCDPIGKLDEIEEVLVMLHRNKKQYVLVYGEGDLKDRSFLGWCIFLKDEF